MNFILSTLVTFRVMCFSKYPISTGMGTTFGCGAGSLDKGENNKGNRANSYYSAFYNSGYKWIVA